MDKRLLLPSFIIGVGLSGFFDGIVLHQLLQWHHLLSLVPGTADIGTQILADGLFHVLMYAVTSWGLWLLWRRRTALASPAANWRHVAGGGLLGYGAWNIVDVGFFHWILGIHRIRVDVPDPLLYDWAWLIALGLAPLVIGWTLFRQGGRPGASASGGAMAAGLAIVALLGGVMAALPPRDSATAMVFFAPGSNLPGAFNVAVAAGTPVLWMDPKARMMAVRLPEGGATRALYRHGALFVTRSPALAGCGTALAS